MTPDNVLQVASLLDIAGTKAAVVYQRAESKDYIDILALLQSGISLPEMMASSKALYGDQYNPMLTAKSLVHFGDGDLYKLSPAQKNLLIKAATAREFNLPQIQRVSDRLSPGPDSPRSDIE